jgi:hypothetical protein
LLMTEILKSHQRLRLNIRLIGVHEIIEDFVLMNLRLKFKSFMERNFSGFVYYSAETRNQSATILSKRIVKVSLILYLSLHKSFSMKVAVQWLMCLLHIREVRDSNHCRDTGYPLRDLSLFSLISLKK